MKKTPALVGEKTRLWLPRPEEAAKVAAYFSENFSFHSATQPPLPKNFTQTEYWRKRLRQSLQEFEKDLSIRWFVQERKGSGEILGSINCTNIVRGAFQSAYLGFSVAQKFEGQGYMTDALTIVIPYLFRKARIHRIMANHLPENHRSARLLERLGFVPEGLARDYLFINGRWRDHVLRSLTNPDWVPRPGEPLPFPKNSPSPQSRQRKR
jgi:ribosomal-protein-alanine N-acetyltransferase